MVRKHSTPSLAYDLDINSKSIANCMFIFDMIVTMYFKMYLRTRAKMYAKCTQLCGKKEGCDPVNRFNYTSWEAVVTRTKRPKPTRNRCVIEVFGSVFVLSLCFFGVFCGCKVFCHKTESNISLVLHVACSINSPWMSFLKITAVTWRESHQMRKGDDKWRSDNVEWSVIMPWPGHSALMYSIPVKFTYHIRSQTTGYGLLCVRC